MAILAVGTAACREVQEAKAPSAPPYCQYAQQGPLCDSFDPSAVPFAVPLALRGLDILNPVDRQHIERLAARMRPRPRSLRVLAPTESFPPRGSSLPVVMPQPEPLSGNPRTAIMAFGAAPGLVDIHAITLFEDRIVSTQMLAVGLRADTLRGVAAYGTFSLGFSLSDRPGSVGDLFRLRGWRPVSAAPSVLQGLLTRRWQRTPAGTPERKIQFFETIVNSGSCAGSGAEMALLLAPAPQAWLDEYSANCPVHPNMGELRRRSGPAPGP